MYMYVSTQEIKLLSLIITGVCHKWDDDSIKYTTRSLCPKFFKAAMDPQQTN